MSDDIVDYLQTTQGPEGMHHHKFEVLEEMIVREFHFDASGRFKVEIIINNKHQMTGFRFNSAESDKLPRMIKIRKTLVPGHTVEIRLTNREPKFQQDLYSMIKGEPI